MVGRSRAWGWALLVGLVVLVAYPLSYGPVVMCVYLRWTPESFEAPVCRFYEPMLQVVDRSPKPVRDGRDKYVGWWLGLGFKLDPRVTNPFGDAFFNEVLSAHELEGTPSKTSESGAASSGVDGHGVGAAAKNADAP